MDAARHDRDVLPPGTPVGQFVIEGFLGKGGFGVTYLARDESLGVPRALKEYLPRAHDDGTDIEARAQMMSAAAMGASAFQKGLGAVHALSHPIGAHHGTHHGTTNAVCMPTVLEFNAAAIRTRFDRAAAYLGIDGGFDGFRAFVDTLNDRLGIPGSLTELGVSDPDIDRLVADALRDPSTGGNPVEMTESNTRALYERLL